MKNNKLLTNTIYLYILSIAKMVFPLITLPYLTRVLSVDMYGLVAYVKSYISYVQLVLDFGFLLSATKDIAIARNKDSAKIEYIVGNTFAEKVFLLVFSTCITFLISIFIPILKNNQLFLWLYFISVGLTIFLPDYLYRGIERMEYIAIPYMCAKAVSVFFTLILVKSDEHLLLIPILDILGNLIAVIISAFFLKKLKIRIRINGYKEWISDLKKSGTYFLSNFATTVFGALTTLVVGVLLNATYIAYWSVCMQIVSAAKSLYVPITNSIYPHMVMHMDIKLVSKIRNLMSIPMALGSLLVMFASENILVIIAGENYAYAGYILKILLPVIIASFYSMLYGWPVLGAMGKERETTISTILAASIQILGILVIYVFGVFDLVSLAVCCGISEVTLLLIRYYLFVCYRNTNSQR